jgi:hypothetical protein
MDVSSSFQTCNEQNINPCDLLCDGRKHADDIIEVKGVPHILPVQQEKHLDNQLHVRIHPK